jgi:2-polyprenyl-3-methyl-5-hydroxy-6-metoxy-1,4-benzoquinol methylase
MTTLSSKSLPPQSQAPIFLVVTLVFVIIVSLRWATNGNCEHQPSSSTLHPSSKVSTSNSGTNRVSWDPSSAIAIATPRPDVRDKFTMIYDANVWGKDGEGSGSGSTLKQTATTRILMELLIYRHNVVRLLDAPCGSAHWWPPLLSRLRNFHPSFSYTGIDVVESVIENNRKKFSELGFPQATFYSADLSHAALPKGEFDMVLCRDALQHLPLLTAIDVISNIARASPKAAAFGSYIENREKGNRDIKVGDYYLINLMLSPFNMNATIDVLDENTPVSGERKYLLVYSGEYLASLDFQEMRRRAGEMLRK